MVLRSMSIEWLKIGIFQYVCSYTTTAPRLSRSVKAATISVLIVSQYFSVRLLYMSRIFYKMPFTTTYLYTYVSCRSIHPPTCAGKVLVRLSAFVHICFPYNAHIRTGLVCMSPIRRWGNKLVYSWLDRRVVIFLLCSL